MHIRTRILSGLVVAVAVIGTTGCAEAGSVSPRTVPAAATHSAGQVSARPSAPVDGFRTTVTAAPSTTTSRPVRTTPSIVASGPRPANGAVLVKRSVTGRGVLTVKNGTGKDGVVTLAADGRAVREIYVRANQNVRLTGVPDGVYVIYVKQGTGWNTGAEVFAEGASTGRFSRSATFSTRKTRNGVTYSIVSVTLNRVPNGNAAIVAVSPGAYPR